MLKKIALCAISIYQYMFSMLSPGCCRYYPSCSQYAKEAIQRFGFIRGCFITGLRLLRCHPWGSGGYDPIPDSFKLKSLKKYG